VPFWLLASRRVRSRATVVTATLHDAPLAVWTPFRTALVGRSHFATHAIHFPLMRLHRLLERRVLRGVSLFALTASGATAIEAETGARGVDVAFLPAPVRPVVAPAAERPLAIGLFGYVYRGKGFDQLAALRDAVDPAIEIVVAGRGTEALAPVPGVRVLGAVEGEDEDRFFAGVRAIVLPYGKRGAYGPTIHVASSVVARALAYRTPIIALSHPGLSDEADVVEGGVRELGERINAVLPDDEAIAALAERSCALAERLTSAEAFAVFARRWAALLEDGRA
jgi:glycosyltransferase involved in cell wall biosynthesis